MAENAPPPTTPAAPDPSRGMPYYEKLRKDLRDALQKKRILDQNLASIEDSIYRLESAYLDDTTSAGGNIIRGFEGYLKGTAPGSGMAGGGMGGGSGGGGGTATRRKGGVTDADRIFSRTSAAVSRDSPVPANSPAHHNAAALSMRESGAHGVANGSRGVTPKIVKKKKLDEDDEKPAKRGKISYARE